MSSQAGFSRVEQDSRSSLLSETRHNSQQEINGLDILNVVVLGSSKIDSHSQSRSIPLRSSKRKHQEVENLSPLPQKKRVKASSVPAASTQNVTSHINSASKPGQLNRPTKRFHDGTKGLGMTLQAPLRQEQSNKLSVTKNRTKNHTKNHNPLEKNTASDPDNEDEDNASLQGTGSQYAQEHDRASQSDRIESGDPSRQALEIENVHGIGEYQDDLIEIELFGQEFAWGTVLDGARMLVGSDTEHTQTKNLPALSTNAVKHLINLINKTRKSFRTLNQETSLSQDDAKTIKTKLAERLAEIHESVENLDMAIKGTEIPQRKKSKIIRDLYAHAIPSLVFMLRWALCCTYMDYSQPKDTKYLKAIVSIQDTALQACEIARSWKSKIQSDTPIVRPTSINILPHLRTVRKAFAAQLDLRKQIIIRKNNESALAISHERRRERFQQQNEENAKKRMENAVRLHQSLNRNALQYDFGQGRSSNNSLPAADVKWTYDQNLELMVQLQNPTTRHLPAEERYLAILNTPLLQNKLPEHIKDRALYYKDSMIRCWGLVDYVQNIR